MNRRFPLQLANGKRSIRQMI